MNKQKQQVLVLAAIVLAGGLYAYFQFLLYPEWVGLKAESAQLAARQAYLERLENSNKDYAALKQQASALKTQLAALDKKTPKKMDKPDIMLTIYNMAKRNGVSPQSLAYEDIKDEGSSYSMGMNFSCTGPAENIYALIDQFQKGDKYILALDSISLNQGENASTANMRLVAYAYKQTAVNK